MTLKGSDVDEDHRLVLISGYLDAVLKAFDLVSELLEQSAKFSPDAAADSDSSRGVFAVHILLEHGKAGKAVGAKGAMMESIKRKSAVQNLRIEKEPKVSQHEQKKQKHARSGRRERVYFFFHIYLCDCAVHDGLI